MSWDNVPLCTAKAIATVANVAALPTGVPEGSIRYVADIDTLYTYDGSAWAAVAGGGGGSGTVTSVSVVSANGLAGTVATATTTPAITLSTSITGILKGNGTAISAGTSGTDYSAGTSGLTTGILKSTTTTGALTIAVAGDFPTLNQNTSGSAATVGTINGLITQGTNVTITGSGTSGSPYNISASASGTGDVVGPASSVASEIALFDGITGKLIKSATGTGVAHVTSGVLSASAVVLTSEVSGTLPVANGGTGITSLGTGVATFLGTPSSANLAAAVTGETGTGALVFATNPALVTPDLGTPSAVVLTSGTGLPLTTGVTGVLPVANGGTNSSTALNNNRFVVSSAGQLVEMSAVTASRVVVTDGSGLPIASGTTTTEVGYVSGVTSAIQTQLNAKGAGTVTSVSVTTANGVSGSVATATTTPAITLTLGAITPTSVAASGAMSGSNLSGTNTGDQTITLTSDVTGSGTGSFATTIAVGAVTDTKGSLANKPACTVVATTNQALTGTPTIDGQATASGSLILLTAQSSGSQNGPWVAAAGAWSRPTWYPAGGTTQAFQFITTLIRLGTTYQGTTWRMTTSGAVTIDTTATTWVVTMFAVNPSTVSSNILVSSTGTSIDGGGSALTVGKQADIEVPFSGTITGWTALADQTGSVVVDVWKDTYANYPPTVADTIAGSELPTITSSNKGQDLSLSTWTTAVTAGDTIRFNVNSCTSITRLSITIRITRS